MRRAAILLALLPVPIWAAPDTLAGEHMLLGPSNFVPGELLPLPPAPTSIEARDELATLHVIESHRTAQEAERAKAEGTVKNVTIFAEALGPRFDLKKLPATKALFDTVRREEKAAADAGKAHFRRDRPWVADPSLHSCSTKDEPGSSYPSGHTSMAYSMAAILTRLAPDHAQAIMLRAQRYALSRLICEVHWPSDVSAGQAYGMLIAERLMQQPAFRQQYDAAAAEMRAAGFK